jgi:hypothetical protein
MEKQGRHHDKGQREGQRLERTTSRGEQAQGATTGISMAPLYLHRQSKQQGGRSRNCGGREIA